MIKLFTLLMLVLAGNAYGVNGDSLRTEVRCIDGYSFLIVYSVKNNSSPAVTQIYVKDLNISYCPQPQPMTCYDEP